MNRFLRRNIINFFISTSVDRFFSGICLLVYKLFRCVNIDKVFRVVLEDLCVVKLRVNHASENTINPCLHPTICFKSYSIVFFIKFFYDYFLPLLPLLLWIILFIPVNPEHLFEILTYLLHIYLLIELDHALNRSLLSLLLKVLYRKFECILCISGCPTGDYDLTEVLSED